MDSLKVVDNQPISARHGDSFWLTDFITPNNPSVKVKYKELVNNRASVNDRLTALWHYVARQPYRETIPSTLSVGGESIPQHDTWFFPAEAMSIPESNCANRTFLLASLIKNELPELGQVYGTMGYIILDGIGAHAWVTIDIPGGPYIIETTQPNLERAFIPLRDAAAYRPMLYFDESQVLSITPEQNPQEILNRPFGLCAVPFLEDYLCQRCVELL
jgi:hypothetical protein